MKILAFNWNNVLTDVIDELQKEHEVDIRFGGVDGVDWKQYDVIVVWNEVGDWGKFVEMANKEGIRTVLVQHGRRGTSRIYPPFNEKLNAQHVCVWGEADKKRLMSCGVPEERIVVTGTPLFRGFTRKMHKGFNVVFSPEHWDGEVPENLAVAKELKKLEGVTVSTKVLEGEHVPEIYENPIISNRNSKEHMEIVKETLATADVVVAISESTFELLAEYLDIPVIIADIWEPKACNGDERYKRYRREYSNGCTRVPLKKLNKAVLRALQHPEEKREERSHAVIQDGGVDIEDPVQEIIAVINGRPTLQK